MKERTAGIEFSNPHTVPITKRIGSGGYGYYVGNYVIVKRGPFAAARAKRLSPLRPPLYAERVPLPAPLGLSFVAQAMQAMFFVGEAPFDE